MIMRRSWGIIRCSVDDYNENEEGKVDAKNEENEEAEEDKNTNYNNCALVPDIDNHYKACHHLQRRRRRKQQDRL